MRLLVANDFSEDVRDDRGWVDWWVQRIAWFARDGDVVLLPSSQDASFFEYVGGLTGTDFSSVIVVTAPETDDDRGLLTSARLRDPRLHELIDAAVAGRSIASVFPLWPDAAVADLAISLDVEHALQGSGFISQGGGVLANSKSAFRAIAAGVGLPLPRGWVCSTPAALEEGILRFVRAGDAAIVKRDFLSGGRGNEILAQAEDLVRPIGARRIVPIGRNEERAVRNYVEERWTWLSTAGRDKVIVEHYLLDSPAYFVEFDVTDDAVTLEGDGEMLYAPFAVGQVMPAPHLHEETRQKLTEGGENLCRALHAIGYRGRLSVDAIVTPDGDVFFTEHNGRITGSTHIYDVIGRQVVGDGYGHHRVILDRAWPTEWAVESFDDAYRRVLAAGAAYDVGQRTGVVFTNAFDAQYAGVMYCVVAETLDEAWQRDRELETLFARKARRG